MKLRTPLQILIIVLVVGLVLAAIANAQTVRNPSVVEFESPDHAQVASYELDIVTVAGNTVIQTITVPKSAVTLIPSTTPQQYRFTINVQPVAFGVYVGDLRAVATTKSDSGRSNQWERVLGAPSRVVTK